MTQPPTPQTETPVCPRHPDRVSYVRCQRCARPVCPDCQRPAAVGVQCVDCVKESARQAPRARTVLGGRAVADERPVVTMAIIAVCAVVWLLQLTSPRVASEVVFAPIVGDSEPWRFLTSAFAHSTGSILHIMFNMFALWMVGPALEQALGRARFIALYLLSAIGGTIVWLLFQPVESFHGVVGASGAVFGLFAAVLVLQRKLGQRTQAIGATIAINMALGFFIPNIAWQAHLGGAVVGGLVALALVTFKGRGQERLQWLALGAIAVVLVALVAVKYTVIG
ncbi:MULTISPECIES: rhomboid family intramembrane serine protease [unclassified Janibacter]|uniref:rhomboid family intramembrane serine protease n=1 Tax=unclassified Janibacter TaxID=2649294 RepID=UPI003CFFBFA1